MVTDLLEEAGEVAAIVKGLEGFKPPEKPKTKEMLATELSDLLYIIFVLAEHYGIELEGEFLQTVNDYILRFLDWWRKKAKFDPMRACVPKCFHILSVLIGNIINTQP